MAQGLDPSYSDRGALNQFISRQGNHQMRKQHIEHSGKKKIK